MSSAPLITPAPLPPSSGKQILIRRLLHRIREQADLIERLVDASDEEHETLLDVGVGHLEEAWDIPEMHERIVEGVFDGERMVGEDGVPYAVPENYASKSKLVEGDLLRLTITRRGQFLYKQKGPIERQRLVGELVRDERTADWYVVAQGHKYRVLGAAVTYFKGEAGDQAVILAPKGAPSRFAALEQMVKTTQFSDQDVP